MLGFRTLKHPKSFDIFAEAVSFLSFDFGEPDDPGLGDSNLIGGDLADDALHESDFDEDIRDDDDRGDGKRAGGDLDDDAIE